MDVVSNLKVISGREQSLVQHEAAAQKKKSKDAQQEGLRAKWLQCSRACACGADSPSKCIAKVWAYCVTCSNAGRKYMKKQQCTRKDCVAARAARAAPPPVVPPPPPSSATLALALATAPGPAAP